MTGFALTLTLAAALSGCAYKPLKAPCASDEGAPPAYGDPVAAPALPPPLRLPDSCGPMKPI